VIYFSDDEWVSSDATFDGDGRFICSYKNPGEMIQSKFITIWHFGKQDRVLRIVTGNW
jgi:hypothetical protein